MAAHTILPVQQPQASGYNHPNGALLDGGKREEYLDIAVPLYRASMEGDLEAAKGILQGREYLVRYSISERKETPLHLAAAGHSAEFVSYLVNMMSNVDLELQNADGNTAFCLAVLSGNVTMAKIMVEKNRALLITCGSNNMMPLHLAASHGNYDMVTFLYDQSDRMTGHGWTNDNMIRVLLSCIQSGIYDVALRMIEDIEQLPLDEYLWDMLQVLARVSPSDENQRYARQMILLPSFSVILRNKRKNRRHTNATPLLRLLWKRIMKKEKDVIDKILRGPMTIVEKSTGEKMETYPSQILFIAAKMNNTKFLVELIREYPDLIWKTNDDGQTIFHIAVAHRHRDIYSLLYEMGSMKDIITPITDNQGNNILHLVGMNSENKVHEDWAITPFQMFNEFLWYKEVEDVLPPSYREVKNGNGKTPHELFVQNHKGLFSEGTESINESINISMVVAALVCAIGFSVVYSIPGGFDQNNGFPMFRHNSYFTAFVVIDVISFLCSSSSIIFFLSAILSRHVGNMDALLTIWIFGHIFLLYSVSFLVMAFILSLFILYIKGTWPLYVLAYFAMSMYTAGCSATMINVMGAARNFRFSGRQHSLYRKFS